MGLLHRHFDNASIKQKLTAIIMLISIIVLLLASGSFILSEVISYRNSQVNRLTATAGLIGANIHTSLVLNRSTIAEQTLSSLATERDITSAFVFDDEGEPFAHYLNNQGGRNFVEGLDDITRAEIEDVIRTRSVRSGFTQNHLNLFAPILHNDTLAGVVFLQANLSQLYLFIYRFVAATFLVFILLALIAYILSAKMQDLISKPILTLADTMNEVSCSKDFSVRVERSTADEIGDLFDGFNTMLEQIQERDELLEDHRLRLEELVRKRTGELQEANRELQETVRELEVSKQLAEQGSQAKSQFLAKMSHEIRTPMIGIMGMAEQLVAANLGEDNRSMAATVHRSSETLLSILDDVLDFSKIEAGKLELESIPVSLQEICEEVVSLFAEQAHEKGLELVCHISSDCFGHFLGDPVRLKQVLLNLVGNAMKFTPEGEIILRAEWKNEKVRLSVIDSGIGIEPQVRKTIFDSFSQADNSMTRKFGGTGLGLAIVQQLILLMNGTCRVESQPGKGSTFMVDLPLKSVRVDSGEETAAANQRVLVVEDHAVTRDTLRHYAMAIGCDCHTASNGHEALHRMQPLLDSPIPAAVILDETMPEPSGLELARRIRALPGGDKLRIGIMTAGNPAIPFSSLESFGINFVLHKPIRLKVLKETLGNGNGSNPDIGEFHPDHEYRTKTNGVRRILLVEDNPTTQQLLALIIGKAGHELHISNNGREAIEALRSQTFDLIFMDCEMPGMDGFETTGMIRRDKSDIPIIALTAHVGTEDRQRCLDSGMNDYLQKPFKQKQLLDILEMWLPVRA